MTAKQYKNLRNIIIIAGIVIAVVIWSFIPDTFKNSPALSLLVIGLMSAALFLL